MNFCPHCGSQLQNATSFCPNCGAPLNETSNSAPAQPSYQNNYQNNYQPSYQNSYSSFNQPVTPVPTGGLIAWAVITLLLCTIPGIVALVKASGINSAPNAVEQQKRISSAKTWCTVGTVLGVLLYVLYFIGAAANARY